MRPSTTCIFTLFPVLLQHVYDRQPQPATLPRTAPEPRAAAPSPVACCVLFLGRRKAQSSPHVLIFKSIRTQPGGLQSRSPKMTRTCSRSCVLPAPASPHTSLPSAHPHSHHACHLSGEERETAKLATIKHSLSEGTSVSGRESLRAGCGPGRPPPSLTCSFWKHSNWIGQRSASGGCALCTSATFPDHSQRPLSAEPPAFCHSKWMQALTTTSSVTVSSL